MVETIGPSTTIERKKKNQTGKAGEEQQVGKLFRNRIHRARRKKSGLADDSSGKARGEKKVCIVASSPSAKDKEGGGYSTVVSGSQGL